MHIKFNFLHCNRAWFSLYLYINKTFSGISFSKCSQLIYRCLAELCIWCAIVTSWVLRQSRSVWQNYLHWLTVTQSHWYWHTTRHVWFRRWWNVVLPRWEMRFFTNLKVRLSSVLYWFIYRLLTCVLDRFVAAVSFATVTVATAGAVHADKWGVDVEWGSLSFIDSSRRTASAEGRRHLRSSVTTFLVVPSTRWSTLGDRTFPVATARTWNELPASVHNAPSLLTFRQELKTLLFRRSFNGN